MGKRKMVAVALGVMMLAGAVMGCGSAAEQAKETETVAVEENAAPAEDTAAVGENTAPADDTAEQADEMKHRGGEPGGRQPGDGGTIVQITAIDGDTITADIGELRPGKPEDAPERPDGEKPEDAQEPPAGDKADGQRPEDAPDHPGREDNRHSGGGKQGDKGGPRGGEFEATEGTLTFTLTEDTVIVAESVKGSEDSTSAELAVGDVLEITLDDNDQPVTITVKYTGN